MATAVAPKVFKNYINGEWVETRGGKAIENRNPANTNDLVGMFPASTEEDVAAAIDAASGAFEKWRLTPAPKRGEILYRAAEILTQLKEDFAKDMTREMGKVLEETRGDVQEAIDMTCFMAGEGRRLYGQAVPSELRDKFALSLRQPVGVCAIITPWNFPMAIPSWKIAPALVCGNTVVFKPATLTPLTAMKIAEIFEQAGLPPGVLNLVMGSGRDTGDELVQNPLVHGLSFTGSNEVGCALYASGAQRLKKIQCEMGGKNPVVVLADADLQLAMESTLAGAFASTGQRCTATSRVVIEEKVADQFVAALVE